MGYTGMLGVSLIAAGLATADTRSQVALTAAGCLILLHKEEKMEMTTQPQPEIRETKDHTYIGVNYRMDRYRLYDYLPEYPVRYVSRSDCRDWEALLRRYPQLWLLLKDALHARGLAITKPGDLVDPQSRVWLARPEEDRSVEPIWHDAWNKEIYPEWHNLIQPTGWADGEGEQEMENENH